MRRFLLNVAFAASALAAGAVAPYPGTVTYTQPDGSRLNVTIEGNEYGQIYRLADSGKAMLADAQGRLQAATSSQLMQVEQSIARGDAQSGAASRGVGLHTSYIGHTGSPNVLVILVQFSDVNFSVSDPKTYFSNWLNQENYSTDGNAGSVRDYFKAQSSGKFTPNFEVYGPVTLGSKRSNYASTSNAYKMVHEACGSLDSQVDFSRYDTDGDGNVDNVYIIFAGQGSNYGGSNAPWPHNSECPTGLTTRKKVDGKLLYHYACTSEQGYTAGQPDGIGTFIHEFGHTLGFPDFYNTNQTGNDTPYFWSIMDRGNYLGYCKTPIGYSAYERHAMDWLEYTPLNDPAKVNLRPMADYNFAVTIETGRSGDFYILENRPATGWDRGIYGGGMLIWHIDASDQSALTGTPNNDSSHLRVKLVRADNNDSAESNWGDAWPGSSNNTSFTSSSTPRMERWNASSGSATTAVDKPVTNIVNSNNLVTFDFRGGSSTNIVDPTVTAKTYTISVSATSGGSANINNSVTTLTAESGTSVTLKATASAGYNFTGWTRNGTKVSTSATYTLTLTEATAGNYVANFTQAAAGSLTVTVEASEGGRACINGDLDITTFTAEAGRRISMTALPSSSGYTFDGWYFKGSRISGYTTTEIYLSAETAGTYTAQFFPDTRKNYAHIEANSAYEGSTRGVKTLTITDVQGGELTVEGPGNANGHPIYVDRTDQVLTVQPGATLTVTGTANNTEWMHSYIYIDFGRDGRFDVDADNTDVHKDLVAHTGYNTAKHASKNDTADPTRKSDGTTVNHGNFFEIPTIVLPEDMAEGTYRLRYKNDWNSNDPYGRCQYTLTGYQSGNFITTNGGSMIDLTLKVVALSGIEEIDADGSAEGPAEYFNLMGVPVAADRLTPGIYIIRRGTTTTKAYVRP